MRPPRLFAAERIPMQPSEKALLAASAQGKNSEAQGGQYITEKQMLNEEWALLKPYLKKLDTEKLVKINQSSEEIMTIPLFRRTIF